MELQTFANIGEFLGGIGVLVSLVYLAFQIRSNTASQRSQNYGLSLERMAAMQERLASDPEYTELFNRGLSDPDQLSFRERTQFVWTLTEMFGNLEFMFIQAQEGNITPALWQRWELTMRWWLTWPGIARWWEGKPTPFTPDFAHCVERCLREGYQPETPGGFEAFMGIPAPDDPGNP